jgi:NADH:ubiquinone oxidoreductase subunit 4 (subunit M)
MDAYLLSLLIWVPVLGGIAVLLLGSGDTTENPRASWGAPLSLLVSVMVKFALTTFSPTSPVMPPPMIMSP